MAEATKSTFLGSISPWSRSTTPVPKSPLQGPKEDAPKRSSGVDHTISLRPSPSLKRYPKDCPPLKTRWYYAVDVAKRKPFAPDSSTNDKPNPQPVPKKFVPFSGSDSQAIEDAFQSLGKEDHPPASSNTKAQSTRIPVNEDYLFDVQIEKRELEPAYWLGPVYEVRRGSWFYQGSYDLIPCDENFANQLEEGYLKVAPWRRMNLGTSRASSQTRNRPSSMVSDNGTATPTPEAATAAEAQSSANDANTMGPNTYRLFGAHMNTTVTYQDATVAYFSTEDLISRIGSTLYGRFGGFAGTKVVRGYTEATKGPETKPADGGSKDKRKSVRVETSSDSAPDSVTVVEGKDTKVHRPSALERQLSSLAGLGQSQNEEALAQEEAREQEEKEMEDAREQDGDDQGRKIDHLVLVTHGIGQRLGLRLDSINFVHDVNTLRKTMKAVYASAPDLQALSDIPSNCTIQVLPVCWRHLLDFPKQSLKNNRKEFDLGDADIDFDDEYPSLQDITVEGVPAVRNLITDLAMDVLLYQSAYREHIASIVQKEANRVYQLFKQRTGFNGKVSLLGHSLGSAIIFDILCRQGNPTVNRPRRQSSRTSRDVPVEQNDLHLDFEVENFFALGSPIALFQMLKGRTIAGRSFVGGDPRPASPFDSDRMQNDPFPSTTQHRLNAPNAPKDLIPIASSSPKCAEFFNIFHPTDPIAYRIEPLISRAMATLGPQPLPYTKKGLFAAPGIANISARVGQQVMSSWYNLTSGVASTLINRSLGITGEEQALPQDKAKPTSLTQPMSQPLTLPQPQQPITPMPISDGKKQQELADAVATSEPGKTPTLIDSELETLYSGFQKRRLSQTSTKPSDPPNIEQQEMEAEKARKLKREEAKVRALNSNGRVDYSIQEGMFDVSLLASIASHLSYWADEDVNHFMVGQMLRETRGKPGDDTSGSAQRKEDGRGDLGVR